MSLSRRTPLRSNPASTMAWKNRTRGPLPKTGKRTNKRKAMNAQLNALHIECCEIRIEGKCYGRRMLTWAHALKSRFLVTDEDWLRAARACIPCHDHIEALGHAKMAAAVDAAIALRGQREYESA